MNMSVMFPLKTCSVCFSGTLWISAAFCVHASVLIIDVDANRKKPEWRLTMRKNVSQHVQFVWTISCAFPFSSTIIPLSNRVLVVWQRIVGARVQVSGHRTSCIRQAVCSPAEARSYRWFMVRVRHRGGSRSDVENFLRKHGNGEEDDVLGHVFHVIQGLQFRSRRRNREHPLANFDSIYSESCYWHGRWIFFILIRDCGSHSTIFTKLFRRNYFFPPCHSRDWQSIFYCDCGGMRLLFWNDLHCAKSGRTTAPSKKPRNASQSSQQGLLPIPQKVKVTSDHRSCWRRW